MPHSSLSLPALDLLRDAAARPLEAAWSLPPACYTDEAMFEMERRAIFARDWICIGPAAAMAEPGDYLAADLPDASLMAVRQKDGSIKAMSRVCRHRGALVAPAGAGHAGVFSCPYHRWTYDLDGSLRAAPAMDGNADFKREACALPAFRAEVFEGFVFVNLDADAAPLSPSLAPLGAMIAEYGIGSWLPAFEIECDWDINWKIAFENASESYHHIGFHTQSLEPVLPGLGTLTGEGGPAYNFHYVPGIDGFRFADVPGVQLDDAAMSRFFICGIYPSCVLVFAGANLVWFTFNALAHDRVRLRVGQMNPRGYFEAAGRDERIAHDRAVLQAILDEDKAGCAEVQRGLQMADAVSGPLSPLERPIAEFVRYLASRLVD
ncbi:MAG: aromatic ring-hydroxylating dioxygenase subunit alpha [Parvibaculum sp.]|uniref:aromatic ring-hydroxylating oxygenase subunit alpha n=1 Tax=Parvibaculum sp. TaxID=2024848 RepID=UPI0025D3CF82|nr:aromatic ring-hydroxylating dioxygenase subunit alpha [Parvibaculum sp.]MCE9651206.1 aromatic ring-hydroxylating dioxygenase subunit alpha [Parvibaculum sp.]